MRRKIFILISALLWITGSVFCQERYALVIHGGAGVMSEENMSAGLQSKYRAKLKGALERGGNEKGLSVLKFLNNYFTTDYKNINR